VDNLRHTDILTVYPNPVVDNLTINALNDYIGKMKVNIYDISGRFIRAFEFDKPSQDIIQQFNLGGLANGSYVMVIQFAGAPKLKTVQLVKQ
jgi:hypothetical protein